MSALGVVIQAGGPGARLAAVTGGAPKALASFAGRTLVEWQLDRVAGLAAAQRVVLACHGADGVRAAVGDRARVIVEPEPLGTAGGLALLPEGPRAWLVLNVDHVSDVDLAAFAGAWRPAGLAALAWADVAIDEGVVYLDGGRLTAYRERPVLRVAVTTGLYVLGVDALRGQVDGRRLDMPALIQRLMPAEVHAWHHEGYWIDAGTPERLAAAEARFGESTR